MLAAELRVAVSSVTASPVLRRLLPAFAVSAVGDGMSAVGVAWLAIRIAPPAHRGLVVGVAVAAYTLPGAVGALALGRYLRHRPARALVLTNCVLRVGFLGAIVALEGTGALSPGAFVALLAGLGAGWTLTASGGATVFLAAVATPIWQGGLRGHPETA